MYGEGGVLWCRGIGFDCSVLWREECRHLIEGGSMSGVLVSCSIVWS